MQQIETIRIADYSEYPGPRYSTQGSNSGEDFYHDVLNQAFKEAYEKNGKLKVILDGTAGYASSFLDEAFGNLVYDFTADTVRQTIEIVSDEEPDWKEMIFNETISEWEQRRKERDEPTITKLHNEWYRVSDDSLVLKLWKSP